MTDFSNQRIEDLSIEDQIKAVDYLLSPEANQPAEEKLPEEAYTAYANEVVNNVL